MRLTAFTEKAEYTAVVELLRPYSAGATKILFSADTQLWGLWGADVIIFFPNYNVLHDYIAGVATVRVRPTVAYVTRGTIAGYARVYGRLSVPARAWINGRAQVWVGGELARRRVSGVWIPGSSRLSAVPIADRPTRARIRGGHSETYAFALFATSLGKSTMYGRSRLWVSPGVTREAYAEADGRSLVRGQLKMFKNITVPITGSSIVTADLTQVSRQLRALVLGTSQVSAVIEREAGTTATITGAARLITRSLSGNRTAFATAAGMSSFFAQVRMSKAITQRINGTSVLTAAGLLSTKPTRSTINDSGRVWALPARQAGITWISNGMSRVTTGSQTAMRRTYGTVLGKSQFSSTPGILVMTNLVTDPINAPIIDPAGLFLSLP